jgi:hypothetical protein
MPGAKNPDLLALIRIMARQGSALLGMPNFGPGNTRFVRCLLLAAAVVCGATRARSQPPIVSISGTVDAGTALSNQLMQGDAYQLWGTVFPGAAGTTIAHLFCFVDGNLIADVPSFQYAWNEQLPDATAAGLSLGNHQVSFEAIDSRGNTAWATNTFAVVKPSPMVRLAADSETLALGQSDTIYASAFMPQPGLVTYVLQYCDHGNWTASWAAGNTQWETPPSEYISESVTWTPTATGTYAFRASAGDVSGDWETSQTLTVQVVNPPSVTISADATSFVVGQSTTVRARFAVDTADGDSLYRTAIESNLATMEDTSGSGLAADELWWNGAIVNSFDDQWAGGDTSFTFVPTAAGTYTFYAVAEIQSSMENPLYHGFSEIAYATCTVTVGWPLTLNASPSNGGSVTGAGIYVPGSVVPISAAPAPGFLFAGWTLNSGAGLSSQVDATTSVTIESATVLTANFVSSAGAFNAGTVTFPAAVAAGTPGITPSTSSMTLMIANSGTSPLTLSALSFTGDFSDDVALPLVIAPGGSTSVPVTFQPSAAGLRTGTFAAFSNDSALPVDTYTLQGEGLAAPVPPSVSISASPSFGVAPMATTLSWSALNATSINVSGMGLTSSAASGSQSIALPAPGAYVYTVSAGGPGGQSTGTATVIVGGYTLRTAVSGSGNIAGAPNPATVFAAGTVFPSLTASPADGNELFSGWSWTITDSNGEAIGSGNSAASTLSLTLSGNTVLTAAFAALQSQSITFTPPSLATYPGPPLQLSASATSGLPVTISVNSGPAVLSGTTLTFTGSGTVTLQASQNGGTSGSSRYAAAPAVIKSITVNPAFTITRIRFNSPANLNGLPTGNSNLDANNVGHRATSGPQPAQISIDAAALLAHPWPSGAYSKTNIASPQTSSTPP